MSKDNECQDGTCAIDYTKETAVSNNTLTINKAYIIPIISFLFKSETFITAPFFNISMLLFS